MRAEGRSHAAVAERLVITEQAVVNRTSNIFTTLYLPCPDDDNRHVLAALAYVKDVAQGAG